MRLRCSIIDDKTDVPCELRGRQVAGGSPSAHRRVYACTRVYMLVIRTSDTVLSTRFRENGVKTFKILEFSFNYIHTFNPHK